ncbi:MAG: hypothetical protein IT356_00845 [Gemmatimonadaceae bacterium]|nr:hypothetical protein [Gemmatimonadaceae bacterium]
MRTTLDIADDVLAAARERARRERSSIGEVISALARQALISAAAPPTVREPKAVYGLRPIASRGGVVTNETIDRLRDDDAY